MSHHNMHNDPKQLPPSNIIIAVVLSLVILISFYFIFDKPRLEALEAQKRAQKVMVEKNIEPAIEEPYEDIPHSRAEILGAEHDMRIAFNTEHLNVSISRQGSKLDDISLVDYYTTTEKTELVHLLTPEHGKKSYVADFGWIAKQDSSIILPDDKTIWKLVENTSVQGDAEVAHRVIFSWDNGQGFLFKKHITLDHDYMFTITQSVTNNSNKTASLYPYGLLSRNSLPIDYSGFFVLHEGPLAFIEDDLKEIDYNDIDIGENETYHEEKGWIGFTDKYWFTGLIPDNDNSRNTLRYLRTGTKDNQQYQTDIVGREYILPIDSTVNHTVRLYAGVKVLPILQKYEEQYNIPNLELAIDFGIYYFMTKPLFSLLTWLGTFFGHIGIGIIVLTIILKTVTFPLSYKAYKSMAMVTKMQPKMNKIKEKYKGDREKLQKAFMELYQKEGVNPFSGCWPMLIQIPIFFSLYKVILTNVMLRHASFFGWISDLSDKDPTSLLNLFGLLPFNTPAMLTIGAWPCLMGLSMYFLNRMSPKPTDPTQAMIKNYFPYLFAVMLARFASGLVIYWTISNLLTILQQYIIMKRMGVPISIIRGHLGHLDKKDDEEEDDDSQEKVESDKETKPKAKTKPKSKSKPKAKAADSTKTKAKPKSKPKKV